MVSQTVLLRGVNDNVETLAALMRAFVEMRIKPYYLHHGDLAPGTSHFRLSLAEGQALVRALLGRLSGLCQPTYVVDIPGGHGKAPAGPVYLPATPQATTGRSRIGAETAMTTSSPPRRSRDEFRTAEQEFTPVIIDGLPR